MASLLNTVQELVSNGTDPDRAVAQAMRGANRADLADTLTPLLVEHAQSLHRAVVRELEKKAFPLPGEDAPAPDVQAESRTKLLTETVPTGNGDNLPWGQMTAEQHRHRAQYLSSMAATTLATAQRHEAAARDIEAAGVTCLDEIPGGTANAEPEAAAA